MERPLRTPNLSDPAGSAAWPTRPASPPPSSTRLASHDPAACPPRLRAASLWCSGFPQTRRRAQRAHRIHHGPYRLSMPSAPLRGPRAVGDQVRTGRARWRASRAWAGRAVSAVTGKAIHHRLTAATGSQSARAPSGGSAIGGTPRSPPADAGRSADQDAQIAARDTRSRLHTERIETPEFSPDHRFYGPHGRSTIDLTAIAQPKTSSRIDPPQSESSRKLFCLLPKPEPKSKPEP